VYGGPHCNTVQREFSLVQIFAELLATALEEIFFGFKFRAFSTWRPYLTSNFTVHIFAPPDLSAKNMKFCTTRNFPLYGNS
jgi:hypothetical protein